MYPFFLVRDTSLMKNLAFIIPDECVEINSPRVYSNNILYLEEFFDIINYSP